MEYIEPCCVGRELLALLKEMPVVPFQTNGNVTRYLLILSASRGVPALV